MKEEEDQNNIIDFINKSASVSKKSIDPSSLMNEVENPRKTYIENIEVYNLSNDNDVRNYTSEKPRNQSGGTCSFVSYSSALEGHFESNIINNWHLYYYIIRVAYFLKRPFNDIITIANVGEVVSSIFNVKVETYLSNENPFNLIKKAIDSKHHIVFSISLYPNEWLAFSNRAKGIQDSVQPNEKSEDETRHAMNIAGYNEVDRYYIVKNHYNEQRFISLPFDLLDSPTNIKLCLIIISKK